MEKDNLIKLSNRIDLMLGKLPESHSDYKRLINHKEMLYDSESYLKSLEHKVVFIGSIGVGKTRAICNLLGLQKNDQPLLKVGSGRTTICEVEIKGGNELSISVEPYSEADIFSYLEDFTYYITKNNNNSNDFKLSAEIERALRNMLDLKEERIKNGSGGFETIDHAAKLYEKILDPDKFLYILKSRINLEHRYLTNIKAKPEDGEDWIRNTFSEINNGLNDHISLPKKIIINLNRKIINHRNIDLSVVDTKGVDQTVGREDIDLQLKNSRNISIFCTRFNDAPDKNTGMLLNHMRKSGLVDYIEERIIILVLDRDDEAENEPNLDEPNLDEGRHIRKERIQKELEHSLKVGKVDIVFFNAKKDNGNELMEIISRKLFSLRKTHSSRIESIGLAVESIHTSATRDSENAIRSSVLAWISQAYNKKASFIKKFSDLSQEIQSKSTSASSLRGSINRNGTWDNFNYYQILRDLYRYQVVENFDSLRKELLAILKNMESQDKFRYSAHIISQVRNTVEKRIEEIYKQSSDLVDKSFKNDLIQDLSFWERLKLEWGKGSGYKDRIAYETENWFIRKDYERIEKSMEKSINDSWIKLLIEIEGLFPK